MGISCQICIRSSHARTFVVVRGGLRRAAIEKVNLQEAANRADVHYQTAYRWVREGRLRAMKSAAAYEISEDEIRRFLAERERPTAPPERIQVRRWSQLQERLQEHLANGDELESWNIVERLHKGQVPPLDICENLFTPVLRWIGNEWHEGRMTVAQEHRASAMTERAISRLTTYPRGRPRGTAVVTTPPGETHRLPSTMAALVLRDDRWRVHHLGSDLPTDESLRFVKGTAADLLVVSITCGTDTDISQLVGQVRDSGTRVLVGRIGATLTDLVAEARLCSPAGLAR